MQTRRDEVLAYLTDQPEGADDDQIASALAIRRQEVNAICRRLADEGRVIRQIGGDGKLVNQRANLDTPEIHLAEPAPPLELPNITVAGPIVLLHAEQEALNLAYPGELMVSEDTVRRCSATSSKRKDGAQTCASAMSEVSTSPPNAATSVW